MSYSNALEIYYPNTAIMQKAFVPVKVAGLSRITAVLATQDVSFAVLDESELFGWGSNSQGLVGATAGTRTDLGPVKLLESRGLCLAAGSKHVVVYNKGGRIAGWGSNEFGQLGRQKCQSLPLGTMILFQNELAQGYDLVQIACGEQHTGAILVDREQCSHLFSWGSNRYFQLGREGPECDEIPQEVKVAGQVKQVFSRHNYSVAVSKEGKLYSWGSGQFGRLGYESLTKQEKLPRQILLPEMVESLALGIFHALALTAEGRVYSWGRGLNGQLGHDSLVNQTVPKPVSALSPEKIVDISAGQHHSLFLTRRGEVYSCGAGSNGELGLGEGSLRCLSPQKTLLTDIRKVSAGIKHNLALSADGLVWSWGSNDCGQLGLSGHAPAKEKGKKPMDIKRRIAHLESEVEQLKAVFMEERKFKIAFLKHLQQGFGLSAAGVRGFLKDL